MDDVITNKITTIKRCVQRIEEEFVSEPEFRSNFTKQDSVILNLQRACEACIDIANHLIRQHTLGVPQSVRDSFTLLEKNGVISAATSDYLKRMVGLRNIAVHDYQVLNLDIAIAVVEKHLSDFEIFYKESANFERLN